ncbi:MAG TPA: hypothetical protein PLI64_11445 [Phycisphaerae bacterium]|nr:hypothetical protein [Phycisphaerae bacterium]HOL27358.1 hypothetical protein [Phycisphaerae bacterium]
MPVETLLINGPRGGGKSTVAQLVAREVLQRPAHYLRIEAASDQHTNVVLSVEPASGQPCPWASEHLVKYTADRVFETVPEALRKVRRLERRAFAILEADADPALRHAFPYDYRIFVMPAPADVHTVFRTPRAAAIALQEVMQDTAAFASEIFGLFETESLEDSVGVEYYPPVADREGRREVERLEITEAQIRQFLRSPLGGEIASRIQLQPPYHAMVESDVVLINTGVGGETDALGECLARIEKLLARVRQDTRRHSVLYWGDIFSRDDPTYSKLLRRLKALFAL